MRNLDLASRKITTDFPAFIMGIVNCTPDSFFSGSRGGAERAFQLIDEGADILDLGGESTRPGSEYVDAEEEIRRVIPVIEEIRRRSDIPISVDTRKMSVMKAAFDSGADILNDVSALEDDPDMAFFAAEKEIPVILMHKRGIPSTMQASTEYEDVFREVNSYLESRAGFALSRGIKKNKIIVDPGIGFGKSLEGNLRLISGCGSLCGGKFPVLMALSRKSCIGQLTGRDVQDRLCGTLAADLFAVLKGAFMLRVHDVAPCKDTLAVLKSLLEYESVFSFNKNI
ncbi:dihydropteroate synthase [Treponema sp.]|uniref:dihydropteroate synthase n=1 Tax=Treponema sp. TaxID=166 RepID=UPI003F066504